MTSHNDETVGAKICQFDYYLPLNRTFNNTVSAPLEPHDLTDGEDIVTADLTLHSVILVANTTDAIFISLHLATFFASPKKKTLPEKNLASYCSAILAAHIFGATGRISRRRLTCSILSVLNYYCFIASFFWMLTMSFDVWRSIRAARRLRLNKNGEHKRFIVYSVCSWLASGICTVIPVTLWLLPEGYVVETFRPDFVGLICGLKGKDPLQWAYNITISVVMILNLVLFIDTSRLITKKQYEKRLGEASLYWLIRPASTNCRSNSTKIVKDSLLNTRRFISLTLQTGLVWILAVVSFSISHTSRKYVRYPTVIISSLQGFFVFCLFTWKKEVLTPILDRHDSKKRIFSLKRMCTRAKLSNSQSGATTKRRISLC